MVLIDHQEIFMDFCLVKWQLSIPHHSFKGQLVASFPLQWCEFDPRSSYVGLVVYKLAIVQVFSGYFIALPIFIPSSAA
jgi:hypothetical protein